MIFSHPSSSKTVSRDAFDSAHSSAWGASHTDLAGIRIMTTVIPRNALLFPQRFIQEFSLSLKIYILLFFISLLTSLYSNSNMTRVPVFIISNKKLVMDHLHYIILVHLFNLNLVCFNTGIILGQHFFILK